MSIMRGSLTWAAAGVNHKHQIVEPRRTQKITTVGPGTNLEIHLKAAADATVAAHRNAAGTAKNRMGRAPWDAVLTG